MTAEKRKRSSADTTRSQKKTARSTVSTKETKQARGKPVASSPLVKHVLVIDNGGDTLKYGWMRTSNLHKADNDGLHTQDSSTCSLMPNVTARLPQQWTILAGDQLTTQIQNPNSLIHVTRSTERGIITNLGNQLLVWKRILNVIGVQIPAETIQALGWSQKGPQGKILPSTCAVMLCVAPLTPRCVLDSILKVWFDDLGFARVGLAASSWMAAFSIARSITLTASVPDKSSSVQSKESDATAAESTERPSARTQNTEESSNTTHLDHFDTGMICLVDLGWSAIHIVPTYYTRSLPDEQSAKNDLSARDAANKSQSANADVATMADSMQGVHLVDAAAIRRIPLGGRQLMNAYKYQSTYRQWNLMDQDWVVRSVWDQTAYVSLDFEREITHPNCNLEFVLPDYQTHKEGWIQTPGGTGKITRQVTSQAEEAQKKSNQESDDDNNTDDQEGSSSGDESEGDVENDARTAHKSKKRKIAKGDKEDNGEDDDESSVISEEETVEQKRRRILKERQAEEKRRMMAEAEQQVLNVSVERFTLPEALFRPSDLGFPVEYAGLPEAIVQSIQACPAEAHPALFRSVWLTGGLANLPNLAERLERELRSLAPTDMDVCVAKATTALNQAWRGASDLSRTCPVTKWSVGLQEWEEGSKRFGYKSMLHANGGYLV
jgi:actin-related protein